MEIFEITKNVVANFIDDEDKFIKQQIIDHIIQNGKYYDVINISKSRVKEIVENGLKYEQLKKENEEKDQRIAELEKQLKIEEIVFWDYYTNWEKLETDEERQLYIKKRLEQAEEALKKAEGK